ncbi:MAG: hypothetical protein IJ594_03935 [Oscillospiraceae bacterium]|nr:hypothetical protein [Oscillospiraceae bacterium]
MEREEIMGLASLIADMRRRARSRREEICSDPASEERQKRLAQDIVEFLSVEENFNRVPKSTVFAIFHYLGYSFPEHQTIMYYDMYNKVVEEANRVYTLIDPDMLRG